MYLISLVTIKSSVAFLLVGLSISWLKKLSFMCSAISWFACSSLCYFPADVGWLKSPSRTTACKYDPSCSWSEKSSQIGSPWFGACSRQHLWWSLCCWSWVLTQKPLDLLMAALQRQPFTLNPLLDVEGNPTISLSFPETSELPVAIDHYTPPMGFTSPSCSNGNYSVAFQQQGGFHLLLVAAHAACAGREALLLGCWLYCLSRVSLHFFEIFPGSFLVDSSYFWSPFKTSSVLCCTQHISGQQAEGPH